MALGSRLLHSTLLAVPLLAVTLYLRQGPTVKAAGERFTGPTSSQPLALSADDTLLAVANPDNNSVTLFDTRSATLTKINEFGIGREPNSVAVSPDGRLVYIANTVSGTVSVMAVDRGNSSWNTSVVATIPVGTEPYGLALTPTGRKLYVANARSNSVSVIDTNTNQVTKTIANVGPEPRGIAITNSGGDDSQETVYVTQFLSLPVAGKQDGFDDAKAGHVTVISASTDTVIGDVALNPIADTGFKAAGDALARVAPPAAPVADDFKFVTGAYPNQLNGIAIRGKFAYVPNTGASPNGPTRFDVNTQSLLSVVDTVSKTDAGKTINMHSAVARQTNPAKRFITQPWAIAFKRDFDEGYVVSAASNIVVKIRVDATGLATVQSDPTEPTRVLEIPTGKNPRGIVLNSKDNKAYVMNYVSRDVTIIDLTGSVEKSAGTVASSNQPAAGSLDERVQIGKELYHTSIGDFDPPAAGLPAVTGRMSNNGWGSCGSCHPFGLSDNVVWIFGAGPRRTLSQHTDFLRGDATVQRALNWSAIFDEEEDFEANIRGVSGGQGLIVLANAATQDPALGAFTPASGGRNQLKVRGVNAWDAIKAYVVNGIRAPISPLSKIDPDVVAGRTLFTQANCQNCHGGPLWTSSRVRAAAPPDTSLLLNGAQLTTELRAVGTFDSTARNEVRANAAAPLGGAGFAPASLLSVFAFPQTFFHNGSADSLDAVMLNVAHRSAGTFGNDTLQSSAQRAQLIKFILSIDAATVPISPNEPGALGIISAASYSGSAVAPDSAVAAFGPALAGQTVSATATPLPAVLSGSSVAIRDSAGALRLAGLYFVSSGQINYLMPPASASGEATVTVYTGSGTTATGKVQVKSVAPGLISMNGDGKGVAAATAIRVTADGAQLPVPVFACGNPCVPEPMDFGSDRLFLTLYGTGLRNRSSLSEVKATVGGVTAPVAFAGAQPSFAGLDQVNLELPAVLKGRGVVEIVVTVDGTATNAVTVALR